MKKKIPVLMLLVAAVFIALGPVQVAAVERGGTISKGTVTMCNLRFAEMDFGHKGYLTIRDMQDDYYGETTPRTYSLVASKFWAMDANRDGKITPDEYCSWGKRI